MTISIELTFDPEGTLRKFAKRLTAEAIIKTHEKALQAAAKAAVKIVKDEYQNAEDLRTWGTLEVYQQGKAASKTGGTQERRTYPGATSMVRTGQVKDNVTYKKTGRGTSVAYTVLVRPGRHNKGDPDDAQMALEIIASQLEEPVITQVPLTMRMNAYLHALQDGTAGRASRRAPASDPGGLVGKGFVLVTPRSRGVWRKAADRFGEIEAPVALVWTRHFLWE